MKHERLNGVALLNRERVPPEAPNTFHGTRPVPVPATPVLY